MTRKEQLDFVATIARCASRAADSTGNTRAYDELRDVIRMQEREHRAFGRRLVGDIGPRMTVEQAVDYFVAQVLARGATDHRYGKAPISSLRHVREDYVRGAILMADPNFVDAFHKALKAAMPKANAKGVYALVRELDYSALVATGNLSKAG